MTNRKTVVLNLTAPPPGSAPSETVLELYDPDSGAAIDLRVVVHPYGPTPEEVEKTNRERLQRAKGIWSSKTEE